MPVMILAPVYIFNVVPKEILTWGANKIIDLYTLNVDTESDIHCYFFSHTPDRASIIELSG